MENSSRRPRLKATVKGVTSKGVSGLAVSCVCPSRLRGLTRQSAAADAAVIGRPRKKGRWFCTRPWSAPDRPARSKMRSRKNYPGITLQYTRAEDLVTAAKILAEGQAGRSRPDILDSIPACSALQEAGLLAPFHGAERRRLGRTESQRRLIGRG